MTKKLTFAFFAAAMLAGMLFVISCQKENGEVSKKEVVVEKQLTQKTSESVFDFEKIKAEAGDKMVKVEGKSCLPGYVQYLYYYKKGAEPIKFLVIDKDSKLPPPIYYVCNFRFDKTYTNDGVTIYCCEEEGGTCTWIYTGCGGCIVECRPCK